MRRPRNRCCFGNRPRNASAFNIHADRRVSRATSCALRSAVHAGHRSFTHRDNVTVPARRGRQQALDPDSVLLMAVCAHVCGSGRLGTSCHSMPIVGGPRKNVSGPIHAKTERNSREVSRANNAGKPTPAGRGAFRRRRQRNSPHPSAAIAAECRAEPECGRFAAHARAKRGPMSFVAPITAPSLAT